METVKLPPFGLFPCWHNNGRFGISGMKLTSKDILLLLGILVAVIITLTTIVYSETISPASTSQYEIKPAEKTSFNSSRVAKKALELVNLRSRVSY